MRCNFSAPNTVTLFTLLRKTLSIFAPEIKNTNNHKNNEHTNKTSITFVTHYWYVIPTTL